MTLKRLLTVGAFQAANLVVPLVTLPLLVARIGIGGFGQYAAMLAISLIFVAGGDLGVQLQGVKVVARATTDAALLGQVRYFLRRRCLGAVAVAAIAMSLPIVGLVPSVEVAMSIAAISAAQLLAAGWVLQGVGRLRTAQACMLVGRFMFMGMVVFLVGKESTLASILLFESISFGAYSILTWIVIVRRIGSPVMAATIEPEAGSATRLSVAAMLQTVYAQIPSILLVKFQGSAAAGQYALAERIANVIRRVMFSMSSDTMPLLANADKGTSLTQFSRVRWILSAFVVLAAVAILGVALAMRTALEAHGGPGQLLVIALFLVLSLLWLMTNLYGILGLVVIANDEKTYAETIMVGCICGILGLVVAASLGGVLTVMAALLVVEIAVVAVLRWRFDRFKAESAN